MKDKLLTRAAKALHDSQCGCRLGGDLSDVKGARAMLDAAADWLEEYTGSVNFHGDWYGGMGDAVSLLRGGPES